MELFHHNTLDDAASPNATISCKFALKLEGLNVKDVSESEVLEDLSAYIEPSSVVALTADSFNNVFVLFLKDMDSLCKLIKIKIDLLDRPIKVSPFVETYIVHCVYPFITNDQLRDIFQRHGSVFDIRKLNVAPNSSIFSHVISSKCEISFLLPGKQTELALPEVIHHTPFTFNVKKFCCACLTEGHSLLHCPDLDDDIDVVSEAMSVKSEDVSVEYPSKSDDYVSDEAENNVPFLEEMSNELKSMGIESSLESSDSSAASIPSFSLKGASSATTSAFSSKGSSASTASGFSMNACCRKRLKILKHRVKKNLRKRKRKDKKVVSSHVDIPTSSKTRRCTEFNPAVLKEIDCNDDLIRSWCIPGFKPGDAYCTVCSVVIRCNQHGMFAVKLHATSKKHIRLCSKIRDGGGMLNERLK